MGKYLVTGSAGSGKSTVIGELQSRGFTAYDTDDLPEVTRLQDRKTGEFVDWPKGPADFSKHAWNWQEKGLKRILDSDDLVFIGASVANTDQFLYLFDKIFGLVATEQTIRQRITTRTNNDAGKDPTELDYFIRNLGRVNHNLKHWEAVLIDASQPINKVADDILSNISNES